MGSLKRLAETRINKLDYIILIIRVCIWYVLVS